MIGPVLFQVAASPVSTLESVTSELFLKKAMMMNRSYKYRMSDTQHSYLQHRERRVLRISTNFHLQGFKEILHGALTLDN